MVYCCPWKTEYNHISFYIQILHLRNNYMKGNIAVSSFHGHLPSPPPTRQENCIQSHFLLYTVPSGYKISIYSINYFGTNLGFVESPLVFRAHWTFISTLSPSSFKLFCFFLVNSIVTAPAFSVL